MEAERHTLTSTRYDNNPVSTSKPIGFKPAPTLKYISDGSGRDFYVSCSSGGLQANYIPGMKRSDFNFQN